MSGYAISYWPSTSLVSGWRAVGGPEDCAPGEVYLALADGPPGDPVPAPPTPADILASQSAVLQALVGECNAQKSALTNRISTLQDAIDLDMATPEEVAEQPVRATQLKAWKTYGVLLGRVTTQPGWPPNVEWPAKPTAGMDLTVSATAPANA